MMNQLFRKALPTDSGREFALGKSFYSLSHSPKKLPAPEISGLSPICMFFLQYSTFSVYINHIYFTMELYGTMKSIFLLVLHLSIGRGIE